MTDKNVQSYFEEIAANSSWKAKYGQLDPVTYNFISRRNAVKQLLGNNKFSSVLDIGCGAGDFYEIFSGLTEKYVGIDFSQKMIEQAGSQYSRSSSNCKFIVASAEDIPMPHNSCDLVSAIGFIEYFRDPSRVMKEIFRVLKPDGTLILQSYQIDFYKKLSHITGFNIAKKILKRFFGGPAAKVNIVDTPYSRVELDALVRRFGFSKVTHAFSNFNLFPRIIRRLFPESYIKSSEKLAKINSPFFEMFAVNYIGYYILNKDH